MTSVTQKLERDFLEAISEEMNSSQSRERELIAHITALLFSTVMNNVLCLKVQQKILGKSIAKNGFIICPTGFPSARFSSGSTFFQPFFHFTKVDSV